MAAPVWVLSVDLQTKTATFQTGMADAAKAARGSFNEIKGGAGEMGSAVGGTMGKARQGVMLLGEEFGLHLPRGITTFVASLGPVGAAMEAAFPFVAIATGALLLIQHLAELQKEGHQLTEDQLKFGTTVQQVFNGLDQKLLQAGIRADELKNDHLGALHKQLQLIDKQSLADLAQQFGTLATAADKVFADLQGHWYSLSMGSGNAKSAFDDFQAKYDDFLAKGDKKGASDLLKGTLGSAERILTIQKEMAAYKSGLLSGNVDKDSALKALELRSELTKAGISESESDQKIQEAVVGALRAQVDVQGKVNALRLQDRANATTATGNDMDATSSEGARLAAEHKQKMAELGLANQRETAGVELTIARATIAQRLAVDTELADKELAIQLAGNQALIAALDRNGKDYQNQLRSLQNKTEELTAEHANTISALENKAHLDAYKKAIGDLNQSEREKVEATQQGSAARLAAIDEAMRGEIALGLQDTERFRELQTQRVEVQRQAAEETAKLAGEAGKEQADDEQRRGLMALASQRENQQLVDSLRRVSNRQQLEEDLAFSEQENALKLKALQDEEAALDRTGKDSQNKLREIQDKEKQLVQQHANDLAAIRAKADAQQLQEQRTAVASMENNFAQGFLQVLTGHQSFAAMMERSAQSMTSNLISAAIDSVSGLDSTKLKQAESAGRWGFNWGAQYGGPLAPVLAPAMAATFFAGVMAFEGGGIVPGVGRGDIVPAMLEPGEGIVPNSVMGRLDEMTRNGGGGDHYHMTAHFAPKVQAFDAAGVDKVLEKHAAKFQQHFESTVRRMNK